VERALVSVYDKSGLVEFVRQLATSMAEFYSGADKRATARRPLSTRFLPSIWSL
jgi:AICAR transformylase/IMP cyclohydrolase PurH